jgi:hypothetical protein
MFEVTGYIIVSAIAFVVGLLVGRRNPSLASTVATVANTAKGDLNAALVQHQIATGVPVVISVGPTGPSGAAAPTDIH